MSPPPYGSRTRISTCVSVGLIDPNIYFAYFKRECNLSEERLRLFAEYGGVKALCILRTYEPTNPGKRSLKYRMDLIAPQKDVGLDLDRIGRQARKRYRIKAVRPS